jgi:predicted nucleic acid-binding protein
LSAERFFLDTAYVQALLNIRDQYHRRAGTLYPRVRAAREVWVTEAVLTEVGNPLADSLRAEVVQFIEYCYTTPNIRVVSVDTSLFQRGLRFYRECVDKAWGLTDCISFLVIQDQGLDEALTADEHFRQAGFWPLLCG